VDFSFSRKSGEKVTVTTLEESEFPAFYHRRAAEPAPPAEGQKADQAEVPPSAHSSVGEGEFNIPKAAGPQTGHFSYHENQRGVTFDALFGPYLVGAQKITITDPYIRAFHQVRNVMELIETIAKAKSPADEVEVHLVTCADGIRPEKQVENLGAIAASCEGVGIKFSWEFDETNTIHARHVVTDTGWKIAIDRGLDIFQQYELNDAFSFANRLQQFRSVKAFEVIYLNLQAAK